ncbi:MAG: hypothetical protein Q7J79_08575 [Gemmatimonadales bacterium]|nr:hypothetical protein [Gemmatimonadales bacterium]
MLIFEAEPGSEERADGIMRAARGRAEEAGWHCWAYRNEIAPNEITLFLEGPKAAGDEAAVFGDEIADLRALARRFEPVRSLVEHPLESGAA